MGRNRREAIGSGEDFGGGAITGSRIVPYGRTRGICTTGWTPQ